MGNFDEYVLQNLQKKDTSFESSQEIKEELDRTQKMLSELDGETQEDQKTKLTNQVNTMIGFLNQLIIRVHHPYLKEIISSIEEQQKNFIAQLDATRTIQDEKTLLQTLGSLEKTVSDYYSQVKENMISAVQKGIETIDQRENILKEVETMVSKMNTFSNQVHSKEQTEILQMLAGLYGKAMQEDISTLNGLESEVALLKEWKENAEPILQTLENQAEQAKKVEKTVSLFDKITDQIVDYSLFKDQDKIYVQYQLEDGSYYFAVVQEKNQIDKLYQQFQTNSSLSHEQNKEAWKSNLEVILSSLQVYYQMNEWVRFEEISNKGKMTKEKDLEIMQYKKILSFMEEQVLKPYLAYADALSKQVLTNENSVSHFYDNVENLEATKKESHQFIINVLGNQEASKEITSDQILKTLYSVSKEEVLGKMVKEKKLDAENEIQIQIPKIPIPSQTSSVEAPTVITNYDEMNNYFNERKNLLSSSLPENVEIPLTKRREDPILKDVNQYLDLEEAKQTTNLVYQTQNPNQGDYAKFVYLQEGKLEGFTSKYQAREIATQTDRNQYFYLMVEQAIKDYATFNEQRKENPKFGDGIENMFSQVGQAVLEEQFNTTHLVEQLITDDTLLSAIAKNFDGRYLIPEKGDSPLFDKVLSDYERGNPMFAMKVKNALTNLKDQFKTPGYQVPTKSGLMNQNQPLGKVV